MTALPLRNNLDWPNMGEIDTYLEVYSEWDKLAGRLSEINSLIRDFAEKIEGAPPIFVPKEWPSHEQLQELALSTSKVWEDLKLKWQAIPAHKRVHARALPDRIGHRQRVPD